MKKICPNFNSFRKILTIAFFCVVLISLFHKNVFAASGINRTINFQGKLVNNPAATNVSDTSYTVIFTIYDKSSGGTALWTETQSVTTADGIFRVNLGAVTPFPANFNFNWSDLYLGVKVNADAEMTPRVQLAAVPYAFNSEKVSGLTVQDESGNASTSGTLKIPNAKTIGFTSAFNVTIQSTADTTITLPASGTLITNTAAAVQTVTSTQTSGTVLGVADSTGLSSSITGFNIALTSSTNSQNKTGISFDLSGGTGGTYYDLLGSGSTWSITRAGALTVASCSGCGAVAGGGSNWTLDSTLGLLRPNNNTLDLLIGGIATASAKFAFTGLSSLTNQTQASISGQLIVMPNNGYSGKVGIGTTSPAAYLDISGTTNQLQLTNSAKRFEVFLDSSYNVNFGHAYSAGDNILQYNFNYYSAGGYETQGLKLSDTGNGRTTIITQLASGKLYWVDGAGAAGTLVVGTWENPSDSTTFKAEYGKWTISAGSVGLGTTAPASQLHVTRALSAGATGKALAIFDQIENQDIFTASNAAAPIFTITRAGGIALGTNGLTVGTNSQCIIGGTTASWGSCGTSSGGGSNWTLGAGFLTPNNSTVDLLFGGQSTPAAAFRVTGKGGPFAGTTFAASVSANTSFAAFVVDQKGFGDIFAASTSGVVQFSLSRGGNASTSGNFYTFGGLTPTIQSTQNRTLTIGGDRTGDISFNPGNSTTSLYLNSAGNVGLGTANPASTSKFQIEQTKTDTSGFVIAMNYNFLTVNPASASTGEFIANRNVVESANGNTQSFVGGSLIGLYNQSVHGGTQTLSTAVGVQGVVKSENTGTISDGYAFRSLAQMVTAAGTIANYTGFYASKPTISGGGTMTTAYGLQIEGLDIAATTNIGARIDAATTQTLWLSGNADNTTAAAGIAFGSSRDTNLYRSGANTLKTDDAFNVGGNVNISAAGAITGVTGLTLASGAINLGASNGTTAQCLLGGTTAAWGSCSASSTTDAFWNQSSGVVFANNSTVDFLAGGQSTPAAALRVTGQDNPFRGTLVTASVSANTSFAAFVVDQKGFGDIFAASTSGVVQFSLSRGGNASTSGNFYTFGGLTPTIQSTQNRTLTLGGDKTGNITLTPNNGSGGRVTFTSAAINLGGSDGTSSDCLKGGATASWGSCGTSSGGGSNWTLTTANGTLSPNNNTLDFLIGGIATTSAKFAVLNVNGSASPIASLSATTASGGTGNGIVLDSTGSIQTLRKNTLTLGGTTTGNIQIVPGGLSNPALFLKSNGDIGIGANNISPLASLDIRVNTANSGGTLAIASVSGTTSFAGLLIDQRGAGDILTASTSGVQRFSITNTGGIKLGQMVGTSSQCLLGGATASWGSCGGGGSLFTDAGAFSYLTSTTDNLVLGGSTVAAATFYMDVAAGALYLGTNNTGTGGVNGLLTLYSSGNGIADPTIAVDASGNLTLSATQAGASVIVGDGSGNISLSLTAAADALIADKTVTLAAAYSGTDFTFSRILTSANSAYNMSGAVLYVTDTSTGLSNNTSTGDLILGNAALTTTPFTGNLLRLQTSGSDRVIVTYSGQIGSGITPVSQLHITRPLSYGATGKALTILDQIENQDIFTASASGTPIFTITKTGGIALGTNGLTFGTGSQCLLGGATATWGACGSGGADSWQVSNGLLFNGNQTVDFAIGGTSTASADFIFGTLNGAGGGVPTATFSGNLVMNSRPNSAQSQIQRWTKISDATAGTIASGGTANIASISASVIYNGSLYVGTSAFSGATGQAEIYRYNGPTLGTWTKVSNATAGTIGNGATGIASVSAMTVYNGYLYAGTSKQDAAEIYRYNGGTDTWVRISQSTAGQVASGGTTLIDGITAMAVYNGILYAGTKEPGRAQLYRYEGGTTWTLINSTTIGTFVTTNTVNVDAITSMSTANGFLYLGLQKNGDADVLRYNGGQATGASTTFLSMNAGGTTGSYLINNAASTAFSEVTAMAVYNGAIVVGLRKTPFNSAEVVTLNAGSQNGATSPDSWQRLGAAAGQLTGTANIDSVTSLAVYNGRLYAGTWEQSSAEIYRYESPGVWTKVSGGGVGAISGATGATTGIWGVSILQSNTDMLYAMTSKLSNGAEVYAYQTYLDQSYSLTFRATPGLAGGVQNGLQEEASIFFLASSSAIANNRSSQNGVFVFTNSITTRNGAYDVAEDYPTRDDTLSPGDLISIDTNERGFVKKSSVKSDNTLIGVYSENPALRLSETGERIDNSMVVPVALVGRVPLKVSTENGKIKSGDALTSSSIPGVAMKATKAGVVIAQAMAPYEEEGVGKIMVYVKSNSYNGTTAELFQGIDMASPNFDQDMLAKLEQNKAEGLTSEIFTDRLVAGLEIFTPKLVAGEIFAKKIRADQIEGLELLIGKIKYSDSINNALNSTNSAVLGFSTQSAQFNLTGLNISENSATVSADLNVKGNSMFEGMITVIKSIITPNLMVSDFASFFGDVVFKKNINIEGRPTFNSDTAGFAVVNKGKDTVTVEFENEYLNTPIITANIVLDRSDNIAEDKKLEDLILNGSVSYVITQRTAKGFNIRLNKVATTDISFSWVAISVKNPKTQSSNTNKVFNPEATKSAGFQSILNQLNQN